MSHIAQHRQRLHNALRQPVAAITAVEVDTVARARELIADLRPAESDRPSAVVELDARATRPEALLAAARAAVEGWPDERGVLFVVDCTGAGETEPVDFWRGLNFLRESWDALAAHVVFLLLPLNYRLLMTVADHLADWIPLRFHFLEAATDSPFRHLGADRDAGIGLLSPDVARQRLAQLEPALAEALRKGVEPATVLRRFHLPMFAAAVSLGDHHRAAALFRRIDEQYLAESDRPAWWLTASVYHLNRFELDEAARMATRLLEYARQAGDAAAEGAATHQLGRVAQEQRDFAAAEQWCRASREIWEKLGDEHNAAGSYHQLGRVAEEQRDFAAAEQWYRKSLAIKEKLGDEHRAAISYHQLGRVAQERRDFAAAEQWYRKSLAINEKLGNEHGAASTYHQLGRVAEEQRDLAAAEEWYRKSLATWKKLGAEHNTASTYHQLGIVAQERCDLAAAERWYRKSLAVSERLGDEHGTASTYAQLGILAGRQGEYEEMGIWLVRSIQAFAACNDSHHAAQGRRAFAHFYRQADADTRAKLAATWHEAGLGELPEVRGR